MDHLQLLIHPDRYANTPCSPTPRSNTIAVYFLYPETAGRSLEDIDRLYAGQTPLLIFKDKEATSSKRPQRFIDQEEGEVRRHSSVVAAHVHAANSNVARASGSEKGDGAEFKNYHDRV